MDYCNGSLTLFCVGPEAVISIITVCTTPFKPSNSDNSTIYLLYC